MHDDDFFHPTQAHSNTDLTSGVSGGSCHQPMGDVSMGHTDLTGAGHCLI